MSELRSQDSDGLMFITKREIKLRKNVSITTNHHSEGAEALLDDHETCRASPSLHKLMLKLRQDNFS